MLYGGCSWAGLFLLLGRAFMLKVVRETKHSRGQGNEMSGEGYDARLNRIGGIIEM